MGRQSDKYANICTANVTLSAANTLTFQQIITGVSLGTKQGWLIDQIDYMSDGWEEMTATGDQIQGGITTSNTVSSLTAWATDKRIIHSMKDTVNLVTSGLDTIHQPLQHQFSPPMIVSSPFIYLGAHSVGLANPITMAVRIYYRLITLTAQEYLEIAEAWALVS